MSRPEPRPRVSREEWAKRVERWRDSGLTAQEFANGMGINAGTLKLWKYQFDGERRGTRSVTKAGVQSTPERQTMPARFVEIPAQVTWAAAFARLHRYRSRGAEAHLVRSE